YQVTLTLSAEIYTQVQRIADQTAQPIEKVLEARLTDDFSLLANLPQAEQAELAAFRYLSDDALWGIAREQTPAEIAERQRALMDQNNFGSITPEEYAELEQLVERGNRLMLRKAEAAALLTERGHSVRPQQMAG
ncbi:MAG: hypothetical protein ACYDEO_23730, partial [Aggregatilineales bacterium]